MLGTCPGREGPRATRDGVGNGHVHSDNIGQLLVQSVGRAYAGQTVVEVDRGPATVVKLKAVVGTQGPRGLRLIRLTIGCHRLLLLQRPWRVSLLLGLRRVDRLLGVVLLLLLLVRLAWFQRLLGRWFAGLIGGRCHLLLGWRL